ncbi:MAG: MFS transporter [Candidatus Helarchaeota archaeon]
MAINELEYKEWNSYHTFLVIFLSVNNFINLFTIVYTGLILPQIASSFNITTPALAGIFSIIGIGTILSVLIRTLPDKIGRKPSILIIILAYSASSCLAAISFNLIFYIIFRFLTGIFNVSISNVVIAEEMPARNRAKVSGVTVSIGMSSSLLASFLVTVDIYFMWRYYFLLVNIPAVIIFIVLWFRMKETRRFAFEKAKPHQTHSIFCVFQKKYLRILVLSSVLLFLSFFIYSGGIKRYFTVFLFEEKGFNPISVGSFQPFRNDNFIGLLSFIAYIGSIIGYWASGFSDKYGRKKTIYTSAIIHIFFNLMFIFGTTEWQFIVSLFGINLTFSIFHTCILVMSVEFWPTSERATGSGWVIVFSSMAGILGNLMIYYLASEFSWGFTFLALSILPILLILVAKYLPETKQRIVEEIVCTEIDYI